MLTSVFLLLGEGVGGQAYKPALHGWAVGDQQRYQHTGCQQDSQQPTHEAHPATLEETTMPPTPFVGVQGTHGIEHGEDGDSHVGKDGKPHGGKAEGGKQQHGHLDTNGKPYVLAGYSEGAAGNVDGEGYLGGLVVHEHHVGSLDGSITAQASHGNAHIGTGQHRGVVDAIADEGNGG